MVLGICEGMPALAGTARQDFLYVQSHVQNRSPILKPAVPYICLFCSICEAAEEAFTLDRRSAELIGPPEIEGRVPHTDDTLTGCTFLHQRVPIGALTAERLRYDHTMAGPR